MATIEVDWDVSKAITLRRETESMTPNDVLRKLLGLPSIDKLAPWGAALANGVGWKVGGAFFPEGTEFRANYGGKLHTMKIESGVPILNGKRVYSPSEAAQKITGSARNGWFFWECRLPGQAVWRLIDSLRKQQAV